MLQSIARERSPQQIQTQAHYLPITLDRNPSVRSSADADASLVEALKAQTATAFDDLVKRYGQRLLKSAMRITKNREDAEDVVQESFLKVFKNIDSFRSESKFATWLTRIAINEALMLIRYKTQKFVSIDGGVTTEDKYATPEIPAYSYTPEQLCAQREFEGVMLNFENVRKSSQRVMELRVKHELSDIEIAQVLNLTLSAVKARLHRGRLDLREATSRSSQLGKLARTRMNIPATIKKREQRRGFISASTLAIGSLLPARFSQSSTKLQSSVTHHYVPQLLTCPRTASDRRPRNCF